VPVESMLLLGFCCNSHPQYKMWTRRALTLVAAATAAVASPIGPKGTVSEQFS
jgi:hypothetical protein